METRKRLEPCGRPIRPIADSRKAKLYELINFVENPIKLVEVRGISKRQKKQVDLTIEQCFLLLGLLPEPYRLMAFFALRTGLRIEESLALDWEKIDISRLCMKVEEALVHGRIGPVKTEYSEDELPLDPEITAILLDWKRASNAGDVGWAFRATSLGGATTPHRCSRTGSGGGLVPCALP